MNTHRLIQAIRIFLGIIIISIIGGPSILIAAPVYQWHTYMGGASDEKIECMVIDGSGNLYVAGYTYSDWGGSPVRAYTGSKDAFVAKYSSGGTMLWHTFLGSSDKDEAYGIVLDASNNVYITGYSKSSWGTPVSPHSGNEDAFAAKISSSGALVWNTFLGGGMDDRGYGITIDSAGNLYATGYAYSTWGTPVNAHTGGFSDIFLARLNNSGAVQWHTFQGGPEDSLNFTGFDMGFYLALDGDGNIYVAGQGTHWGNPIANGGYKDIVLLKFNPSGGYQWHTFMGNQQSFDQPGGIAISSDGYVFVTGASFGNWGNPVTDYSIIGAGGDNAVVVKLDTDGNRVWNTFTGAGSTSSGIVLAGAGIYIGGSTGDSRWGVSEYKTATYMAKFNSSGAFQYKDVQEGVTSREAGHAFAWDGNQGMVVAGHAESSFGAPLASYTSGYDGIIVRWNETIDFDSLTVTYPNTEDVTTSTPIEITWTSTGNIPDVRLEYTLNDGWIWQEITSSTPNDGSYEWTTPKSDTTLFRVRISDAADGDPNDISDKAVDLYNPPSLTIYEPLGGERFDCGASVWVEWSSAWNRYEDLFLTVYIDLSIDDGTTWHPQGSRGSCNAGQHYSFHFYAPEEMYSRMCRVRVRNWDHSVFKVSESFTIGRPKTITPILLLLMDQD